MKLSRSPSLVLTAHARTSTVPAPQSTLPRRAMYGVAALALTSLVTGCGVANEEDAQESVEETSEALTTAGATFRDTSTMRGSTADWDACRGKATCAPGEAIAGISVLPADHLGRTALCESYGTSVFTGNVTAALTLDDNADHRRAARNGDWAPGFLKLECGNGEYASGVSENVSFCQGNNRFHGIQCASGGAGMASTTCTTRTLDTQDDRGTTRSGDWDYGTYKGECESDEYVAGVSADPANGRPHSLLCCHLEQMLPQRTFWGKTMLREFTTTSAASCSDACLADGACSGGTFNPDKKWCWLLTGNGDIQDGLVSDYAFTVKPAQRTMEQLARGFAPKIYMQVDEHNFPSSTDFFLPNVHAETRGAEQFYITNQDLGCDSCTNPSFLAGQNPSQVQVPAYAEIVDRTQNGQATNVTDVIYWTFYPYNNGKRVCIGLYSIFGCIGGYTTAGNHVGDWESATIRFVGGRPSQVYLSQHDHGQLFNYGDPALQLSGGRPVLYAAQGSHGLYADAARHTYKSLPNGDTLNDDTSTGGALWDTAAALVTFRPQSTYTGSLAWLNYKGRWGNPKSGCGTLESISGECVLNDGPGSIPRGESNPENWSF
jgi:hypothetical protein